MVNTLKNVRSFEKDRTYKKIRVKKNTINHYKPEKFNGAFNDKYSEYKNKGVENLSIQQYLEKIRAYLGDMIDEI